MNNGVTGPKASEKPSSSLSVQPIVALQKKDKKTFFLVFLKNTMKKQKEEIIKDRIQNKLHPFLSYRCSG